LIVDDDQVGRKLFRRRFSRIFPDGRIDEVESGEEAIEKVTKEGIIYDAIFMDHFMAVKKMNGAETIRELRKHNVDSLIIGVSGNSKEDEHVSAGADFFFQKPLPPDDILLHAFLARLPPPKGWNVLVVDDVKVNIHFLRRKLQKASSAHFTTIDMAQKHWLISMCTTGKEAMDLIQKQHFDLLVLDQNLGDDTIRGTDIAEFARECGVNKDSIIVLNSGSELKQREASEPFDLYWPKPLPSVEQMRRNLCRKLVQSRASIIEKKRRVESSNRKDP
jgi:CheY-like chemotaxis protein